MTQQQHPITPPPELVQQWGIASPCQYDNTWAYEQYIAAETAKWAADQELEACCEEFSLLWDRDEIVTLNDVLKHLRTVRRPKPPSLKEQALIRFESFAATFETSGGDSDLIRRALEALPE
jgi:hypothetical protein